MSIDRAFTNSPPARRRWILLLLAVSAGALVIGAIAEPQRTWGSLLLGGLALTGVALAAMLFVAIEELTGARWSLGLRPVARRLLALLPPGAVMVLTAVTVGGSALYPWAHPGEHLPPFRAFWLQPGFHLARTLVYLGSWMLFARAMRRSIAWTGQRSPTRRATRLSAAFVVVFGVTICLAAFDWMMSLEPHWYSTMYGVIRFAGLFTAGLAAMILLAGRMARRGEIRFTVAQRHDLGKLLFGFATFWMYVGFSQYMLIWYANLAEEAVYYTRRLTPAWGPLVTATVLLMWIVPFALLLPRAMKVSPRALAGAAVVVLAGHVLDLYVMIIPSFALRPRLGGWELAAAALTAATASLALRDRAARTAEPIPLRSREPFEAAELEETA